MNNINIGDSVVSECGFEGFFVREGDLKAPSSGGYDCLKLNTILSSETGEHKIFKSKIHLKKDVDYIKSFKHMIGVVGSVCGIPSIVKSVNYDRSVLIHSMGIQLFYDEDNNLLSYKEYMQLYYPEYEFVWKEQLSEN